MLHVIAFDVGDDSAPSDGGLGLKALNELLQHSLDIAMVKHFCAAYLIIAVSPDRSFGLPLLTFSGFQESRR